MLSTVQKNIIFRALEIRKEQGEDPQKVLEGYKNLTDQEKTEMIKKLDEKIR